MNNCFQGKAEKLIGCLGDNETVQYGLPLDGVVVPLNNLIGQKISLEHLGVIHCVACGRQISKSFQQGYCFPCTQRLAQCDLCIVKPERCHFHLGTCREPDWGEAHCMQNHVIYLANSSGLKVGITREKNILNASRWIDQGATQGLPILKVSSRRLSGLVEISLAQYVADKTDWRKMLKGIAPKLDLIMLRDELLNKADAELAGLIQRFGESSFEFLDQERIREINYPALAYPEKITSLSFEKTPVIEGVLMGIKGQYLILDIGVMNVRSFGGYQIKFSHSH